MTQENLDEPEGQVILDLEAVTPDEDEVSEPLLDNKYLDIAGRLVFLRPFFRLLAAKRDETFTLRVGALLALLTSRKNFFSWSDLDGILDWIQSPSARRKVIASLRKDSDGVSWLVDNGIDYEIHPHARALLVNLTGIAHQGIDREEALDVAEGSFRLARAIGVDEEVGRGQLDIVISQISYAVEICERAILSRNVDALVRALNYSQRARDHIKNLRRLLKEFNDREYNRIVTQEVISLSEKLAGKYDEVFALLNQLTKNQIDALGRFLSRKDLEDFTRGSTLDDLADMMMERCRSTLRIPVVRNTEILSKAEAFIYNEVAVLQSNGWPEPVPTPKVALPPPDPDILDQIRAELEEAFSREPSVPLHEVAVADTFGESIYRTAALVGLSHFVKEFPVDGFDFNLLLEANLIDLPEGPVSRMTEGRAVDASGGARREAAAAGEAAAEETTTATAPKPIKGEERPIKWEEKPMKGEEKIYAQDG